MAGFTTTDGRAREGRGGVLVGKTVVICEGFVNELPRTTWLPHQFTIPQ